MNPTVKMFVGCVLPFMLIFLLGWLLGAVFGVMYNLGTKGKE